MIRLRASSAPRPLNGRVARIAEESTPDRGGGAKGAGERGKNAGSGGAPRWWHVTEAVKGYLSALEGL